MYPSLLLWARGSAEEWERRELAREQRGREEAASAKMGRTGGLVTKFTKVYNIKCKLIKEIMEVLEEKDVCEVANGLARVSRS